MYSSIITRNSTRESDEILQSKASVKKTLKMAAPSFDIFLYLWPVSSWNCWSADQKSIGMATLNFFFFNEIFQRWSINEDDQTEQSQKPKDCRLSFVVCLPHLISLIGPIPSKWSFCRLFFVLFSRKLKRTLLKTCPHIISIFKVINPTQWKHVTDENVTWTTRRPNSWWIQLLGPEPGEERKWIKERKRRKPMISRSLRLKHNGSFLPLAFSLTFHMKVRLSPVIIDCISPF